MKKYKNIVLPIIVILIGFSACKKEDSPLSPILSEYSIKGLWQESFYGNTNLEIVIKIVEEQNIIYTPDSILKTSQLKIDKDSFQVLIDQTYFLDGDTLLANQKVLKGIYEIINDTLSFTDSFNRNEKYYYELADEYLQLIYAPIIQSGDSLIWISSNIGIPWGISPFKYQGKFTRVDLKYSK